MPTSTRSRISLLLPWSIVTFAVGAAYCFDAFIHKPVQDLSAEVARYIEDTAPEAVRRDTLSVELGISRFLQLDYPFAGGSANWCEGAAHWLWPAIEGSFWRQLSDRAELSGYLVTGGACQDDRLRLHLAALPPTASWRHAAAGTVVPVPQGCEDPRIEVQIPMSARSGEVWATRLTDGNWRLHATDASSGAPARFDVAYATACADGDKRWRLDAHDPSGRPVSVDVVCAMACADQP